MKNIKANYHNILINYQENDKKESQRNTKNIINLSKKIKKIINFVSKALGSQNQTISLSARNQRAKDLL